jgi:hypothetical protein
MKGDLKVVQIGAAKYRTSSTETWSFGKGKGRLTRGIASSAGSPSSGSKDAVLQ